MSMWKCTACGGTYQDHQADGTLYMHACAPFLIVGGLPVVIANPRDESVVVDAHGLARDIRALGLGVTPMQGQTISEPQWILAMRAAFAALPAGL